MGGHKTPGTEGLGAGGVQFLDEGTLALTQHRPPAATNWTARPGRPLNPWRALPSSVRADLINPLNDTGKKYQSAGEFKTWVARQTWQGPPPTIDDRGAYAEWRFNHGLGLELDAKDPKKGTPSYTYAARVSLVCVYVMMKSETSGQDNMWALVESVEWVGNTGNMLFEPIHHHLKVKEILEDRYKYTDAIFANSPLLNNIWGVRSPHAGTALHFRGPKASARSEEVEAHIDLHNPGADWGKALEHSKKDDTRRSETHTPAALIKGVMSRNYTLPPLT